MVKRAKIIITIIQNTLVMTKTLRKLDGLLNEAVSLGEKMRLEGGFYRAELAERQRLGLTGEAAVKHYNDYMDKHGMSYLKVN